MKIKKNGNSVVFSLSSTETEAKIKIRVFLKEENKLTLYEFKDKEIEGISKISISLPPGNGIILYTYCEIEKDNETETEFCYPARILQFKNSIRTFEYVPSNTEEALYKMNELKYFFSEDKKESTQSLLQYIKNPNIKSYRERLREKGLRNYFFRPKSTNSIH
jgi:hypothetical protein